MKTNCFLLAVSISFALVFVFSCSSGDDSPKNVPCSLNNTCTDKDFTEEQCKKAGGTVVQTCQAGGNDLINCNTSLGCAPMTADQCTAFGGSQVTSCPGGSNDLINCNIPSIGCTPTTAELCTTYGGNQVTTCPGGNNDLINCNIPSLGTCASMTADQCTAISGNQVATCPGVGPGLSSSSGGSVGPGLSSSSLSSSSTISIPTPTGYCDYGYPNTAGGGCFPLYPNDNECDEEYGKVATSCGRTDLKYCQYPSSTTSSAGCYSIDNTSTARNKCSTDYGTVVDECPANLFKETFYCYYFDDYYNNELACDKIGLYWYAEECADFGGAIVNKDFCSKIGAEIYNF